jgi:hypothetical protein
MNVANTIRSQIGNLALRMIGARNLTALSDGCGGLLFKTGRVAAGKADCVKIVLTADDLYTVTFSKPRGRNNRIIAECEGVYADMLHDLIEKHTGMYTRF